MLELDAVDVFGKTVEDGLGLIDELLDLIEKIFPFEILQVLFEDFKTL